MEIIKPTVLAVFANDETFTQDAVNEFVMDKQLPLLLKYEEIANYQEILDTRKFLSEIGNAIIDNTINSAKNIRKLIQKCDLGISNERIDVLAETLFYNIQAIQKQSIQRQIAMNELVLIDFNWNVNVTLATDNLSKLRTPLLLLQLILKRYDSVKEHRVNLEFSKEELAVFIRKLAKIQQSLTPTAKPI